MCIERIRCTACGIAVEGQIEIPPLAQLSAEEQAFIELFVRCSGSLKAVAHHLGISYPTVRVRLDRVIASIEAMSAVTSDSRRQILDELERGDITADEAVRRLNAL